jgi:hypothetical protein
MEIRALAGVKPGSWRDRAGAFSLYFGDEPFFHFDLDGRWQRIYDAGTHFRKALDNSVDALERRREGAGLVMRRRSLSFAEIADLDAKARATALDLLDDLGHGRDTLVPPPDGSPPLGIDELRELLERVTRWDADAWFRHREAYLAAYHAPPPPPPDQKLAVVFETRRAADGAPREPREFAAHAGRVLALYGRRIEQANGAYLADAQPDRLTSYLEAIRRLDPDGRLRRVGSDLRIGPDDPFPDATCWAAHRALGLERLWIEVASGPAEARRGFGDASTNDGLRRAVATLHAAGTAVSLGVHAYTGDREFSTTRHQPETIALIASLDLRPGDVVFVMEAGGASDNATLEPGEQAPAERLGGELLAGLRAVKPPGVKVVPYDPDKS